MIENYPHKVKVSVVIVNYNVKFYLEQCILSLFASNIAPQLEIIVVDNNSTDNSKSYFQERHYKNVRFIWNDQNVGFSKANNQAIRICRGEYILLLNPDTFVGEHVLANVVRFMDAHQDAGAVGVKMLNGNGVFLRESKRGFPSPWTSFCKIVGLSKFFPRSKVFGRYHLLFLDENEVHEVDILCGAFMMLRRKTLDKIGLLDESFFMYGEDIDLSYRVTLGGYKNYYLPEKIIHYKGESTKKDTLHYVKIFYHAMYIFFQKYYPRTGNVYSLLVPIGIFITAFVASTRRILMRILRVFRKKKPLQEKIFDARTMSYEEIINFIDKNKDKNVRSRVFSPESGMIICSSSTIKHEPSYVSSE